jgi:hypothetical protein
VVFDEPAAALDASAEPDLFSVADNSPKRGSI